MLLLIADGLADKAIASRLAISKQAVGLYRQRLSAKTGATTRVELARCAVARGLVPVEWQPADR